MDRTVHAIKSALPNFPDEVIREWMLPYTRICGWPPCERPCAADRRKSLQCGRWKGIFAGEDLGFWSGVAWNNIELDLDARQLCPFSLKNIVSIISIGTGIKPPAAGSLYSELFLESSPETKERFLNSAKYLGKHGTFPAPPTLLRKPDALSIVDGNHRIAAYIYLRAISQGAGAQVKQLNGPQKYWVGENIPCRTPAQE